MNAQAFTVLAIGANVRGMRTFPKILFKSSALLLRLLNMVDLSLVYACFF
jgi:hypothetical protein